MNNDSTCVKHRLLESSVYNLAYCPAVLHAPKGAHKTTFNVALTLGGRYYSPFFR